MRFAQASAVAPGDARWRAELAPDWDILGAVNGGYLLAVAARALGARIGSGLDPVSVTGHYLSPGTAGPAAIDTEIIKAGSRFTTGRAILTQGRRTVIAVLGTYGHLVAMPDVLLQDAVPPDLPPPADLPRIPSVAGQPMPPPFMDRIDVRLHPQDAAFTRGQPSGTAQMRAYWRLLDDEPVDAIALLLAADSLPPTTFNAGLRVAWTPTLELTVHVRAIPAPGWLRLDYRTRFISHGRMEIDGVIWDERDQIVAQSRQLALVPEE